MSWLKDLFSENGNASMVRLLALLAVVGGIGMGFYGIHLNSDLEKLSKLCSVFVLAGLGAKIGQKFLEKK